MFELLAIALKIAFVILATVSFVVIMFGGIVGFIIYMIFLLKKN